MTAEHTLKIIVCVKEIADPEAPAELFKLDAGKNLLVTGPKVVRVLNPFDEQAVEAALRIKDAVGAHVTVLALGWKLDRAVVRKPLSMGADELVLLEDEAFGGAGSTLTAHALARAAAKLGSFDLILTGRQSADWSSGSVGLGIAELLGIPSVTFARKIELSDGKARVERVRADGYEIVDVHLPAMITVTNELGPARYPTIANIRAASKIQPVIWKPEDIGFTPSEIASLGARLKLIKLFQPESEETCEIVTGDTVEVAAENLALRLRAEKIL